MATQSLEKVTENEGLPAPLPVGFIVEDLFKNKWTIGEKIGSGGCGVIYKACEADSQEEDYVIKVEYIESASLSSEVRAYRAIGGENKLEEWRSNKNLRYIGISPCYGYGVFKHNGNEYRFLVIERYGTDLQQYLDKYHTLSVESAYIIALIVVDALEYIHSCGFVHGDVKPANLLCGRKPGTENQIYLVDMGVAIRYMNCWTGEHFKFKPGFYKAHNGTREYTSRDSHRGNPCTRRCDFETLAYNLLMWISGTLPWVGIEEHEEIAEMKEKCMSDVKKFAEELFGSKVPPGIVEYLMFVQNLGVEKDPDYEAVRKIFINALKENVLLYATMLKKRKITESTTKKSKSFSCMENVKKKVSTKLSLTTKM